MNARLGSLMCHTLLVIWGLNPESPPWRLIDVPAKVLEGVPDKFEAIIVVIGEELLDAGPATITTVTLYFDPLWSNQPVPVVEIFARVMFSE